jgi:hypothetical protein
MPDTSYFDPRVRASNQAQVDVMRQLLGLAGTTFALGAGARGVVGLGNFLNRNLVGPPRTPMRQSFVRIPVPVDVEDDEDGRRQRKAAAASPPLPSPPSPQPQSDALGGLARYFTENLGLLRSPGEAVGSLRNNLSGWGEEQWSKMPWAYPVGAAALGGGLYGGWKLTDYLLDKTRTREQESELDEARRNYEQALASRYKTADTATPLDKLAAYAEKQGLWNEALGVGLLGGGLLAGTSALATYNWTRNRSRARAIEEAVKRRQAQLTEQAPTPVMAIPVPVSMRRHDPDEKRANMGEAANQWLGRRRAQQMEVWQRMMTPADGKGRAEPRRQEGPVPPQLPTLAGAWSRMTGHQPTPPPQPAG